MESAIVLTVRASIYPHSRVTVTWLDEDAARRLHAQSEMWESLGLERRREDDVQEEGGIHSGLMSSVEVLHNEQTCCGNDEMLEYTNQHSGIIYFSCFKFLSSCPWS